VCYQLRASLPGVCTPPRAGHTVSSLLSDLETRLWPGPSLRSRIVGAAAVETKGPPSPSLQFLHNDDEKVWLLSYLSRRRFAVLAGTAADCRKLSDVCVRGGAIQVVPRRVITYTCTYNLGSMEKYCISGGLRVMYSSVKSR
jgi:hypothetical protein